MSSDDGARRSAEDAEEPEFDARYEAAMRALTHRACERPDTDDDGVQTDGD